MIQLLIGLGTLALIFFFGVGFLCFRTGIVRREDYDRNYVPERDDPVPMSEHATEYRKRARPFNKWWNAQPLQRKTVVSEDGLKLAGGFLPAEEDHHKLAIVVHEDKGPLVYDEACEQGSKKRGTGEPLRSLDPRGRKKKEEWELSSISRPHRDAAS